jgi:NADH dehydrogenase
VRAAESLERLGVTVMLSQTVVGVQPDCVQVRAKNGTTTQIPGRTFVWAAGVTASTLARELGEACGAPVDRAGRVTVRPDLSLPGHPEVLAFGDMVRVADPRTGEGRILPGVAPVAMQQGRYAGRLVAERLSGRSTRPFRYRDKGTLATIGRASAVADINGLRLSGFPAWLTWLGVHLFYLIGFENRLLVLLQWAFSFLTHGRGARLITEAARMPAQEPIGSGRD